MKRFNDEYDRLHTLDHTGLVKAWYGGALATGQRFIELELVGGKTLEDHVQSVKEKVEPLSVAQAIELGLQLLDVLAYLHRSNRDADNLGPIIHRDLSPSNVMIQLQGGDKLRAVVLDLGLSRALSESSTRTQVQGTVCYMAPEQTQGGASDARLDLY